jgi:hypothetical protein
VPPQSSATEATATPLGTAFAHAIAAHDFAKLAELLHPEVEFRALTPRRSWEPAARDGALEVLRNAISMARPRPVLLVPGHHKRLPEQR